MRLDDEIANVLTAGQRKLLRFDVSPYLKADYRDHEPMRGTDGRLVPNPERKIRDAFMAPLEKAHWKLGDKAKLGEIVAEGWPEPDRTVDPKLWGCWYAARHGRQFSTFADERANEIANEFQWAERLCPGIVELTRAWYERTGSPIGAIAAYYLWRDWVEDDGPPVEPYIRKHGLGRIEHMHETMLERGAERRCEFLDLCLRYAINEWPKHAWFDPIWFKRTYASEHFGGAVDRVFAMRELARRLAPLASERGRRAEADVQPEPEIVELLKISAEVSL